MNCKISNCPQKAISFVSDYHSEWKWHTPDIGRKPLKSIGGAPIYPTETTNLCYYHWKKEHSYYGYKEKKTGRWVESPYIGKQSNPTVIMRNGEKRVLSDGWGDPIHLYRGRSTLQPHKIPVVNKSVEST